jgi:hypothetical protein
VRAVIRRGGFASVVVGPPPSGRATAQGQRACAYFGPALLTGAPHLSGTTERRSCCLHRTDRRPPFCISQTDRQLVSDDASVYIDRESWIRAGFSVTAGGCGLNARRQRAAAGQSSTAHHPHRDECSDNDRDEKNAFTTTVCRPAAASSQKMHTRRGLEPLCVGLLLRLYGQQD